MKHKWWHFIFTNLACLEKGDDYGYVEVRYCAKCDDYIKTYVQVKSDEYIEYMERKKSG